jgi:hypothetical protein
MEHAGAPVQAVRNGGSLMSKFLHMSVVLAITTVSGLSVRPLGEIPSATTAQVTSAGHAQDVEAIAGIVATFDQTWGSDPVAYAAQYGDVIEWVGPTGTILTDPAAITGLYTSLFHDVFAGTTRISTIRRLTFLSGTTAVLDIDTQVLGLGRAREKNVLVKRAGEWRILLHQQTFVTS